MNKTVLFAPIFPYSLKRENRGVGNIGLPANTIWNGYATWFTVFIKCALVFLFSVSSVIVKGQPVASFTFTDTAGCSPLVARFTNTSTGATSYSWDLGNGITSSSTDVSASYTSAGSYTVTLTAYGGGLHSTYSTVIRIYGKPIVSFSANDTAVCENAPVTFTSTSVSNAWGGISYIWNFGDGRSSTAASPVYAYPASGFYNVTLFAANSKGCSNSITRSAYIDVFVPPSIIFAAMTTDFCSAPATTSFINATTGKAPLAYTWAFGDGVSSTATAPSHTYSVPAIYNINLIAHDGYGCTDSSLQLNYITVENMKAAFVPVPNGCVNAPVTFNNASTPHISSQWYFGDGGTSTSDTAVYTYSAPGTYTIKLVISDGGCSDTVAHAITISSPPGSFTITHNCAPPYSSQTFTAATAPGNTVAWIFGDGATGSSSPVTHVYHPPPYMFTPPIPDPVYNVDMILTSGLGCTDTVKMLDTVKNLFLHVVPIDSGAGCIPLSSHFGVGVLYNIINPHPPCSKGCELLTLPYPYKVLSYSWNFGDGSPLSTSASPIHIYVDTGVYTVTCRVMTADGCTAFDSTKVKAGTRQHASFVMSKSHVCAGQPITYTSTSTDTVFIDAYAWTFGDGKQTVGAASAGFHVVTHRSELPGMHLVKLVVSNNGCSSVADTLADTIDAANANIFFKYECIPANGIAFADSSTGDDTHLWRFGDGDTSTAFFPVHNYPALTSYSVTLTTWNAATGCRDTGRRYLELKRLDPTLTPYDTNICRDLVDTFTTFMHSTDSTYPIKSAWYRIGSLTDTGVPAPLGPSLPTPYTDTIYHPMHTKGTNNITLIITDNHGCFDTAAQNVVVVKPADSFSVSPLVACPLTVVSFTDHSSDITGFSPVKYRWAFGDGSTKTSGSPVTGHSYKSAGTYTVTETVTDNLGCSDTLAGPVHPLVHKPDAAFIPGSTYNCQGTIINFDNTSTGGISWLWVFGDGATSTISIPSHIYTTVGSYTVRLIATDTYGCTDTATKKNLLSINPLPTASFYMDDSFAVCAPLNVNFINTSIGAPFNTWSFGDGTFSTAVYPSDIYTAPGVYTIKLKVSNFYGCIDTAIGHATVFGYAGAVTYTPANACASVPVHFTSTISRVTKVVWDFDDGFISGSSLLDTISHVYTTTGKYLPKLILTDLGGCSSFSVGIDTIKVDTLIAKFGSAPVPVCENSIVTFHDSSSDIYSSPAAWLWTFAPGATSTARAPTYAYSVSGSVPVTVLVTDGFGCTGTVTKNIIVSPGPVSIAGPVNICFGQAVTLSDITPGGNWSSSNTAVAKIGTGTGVVTSLATGVSTIAYTLLTGCKTTITETVDPVPVAIIGARPICVGDNIPLSDPTTGGGWSSGNTAIAAIGSASGIVTGIGAGTTTITYLVSSGCTATVIIKVELSPVAISGPSTLCTGDTIILSDAVGVGNWSGSGTASAVIDTVAGLINGLAAGTTTITYTMPAGCKTTTIITTNPVPSALTGVPNVCMGLTTTFTDITAGGIWGSSNTTVAGVSAGIVTGATAGTATITYALANGCLAAKMVTVNPLPAAITGNASVCKTQAISLSDAIGGGTWSSPDPAVGVGSASGIVTAISVGAATITYTLGTGCVAFHDVTVDPVPAAIIGNENICVGLTTTLNNDTAGGVWSSPDPTVTIDAVTGIANGISLGTATISYTLVTGCYALAAVTVNAIPPPITGNELVCAGSATTLSDTMSGGGWASSAPGIASVAGTGLVTGVTGGTATIIYTSAAGCTAIVTVTVDPVIAPITGKNVLCKGTITALSDAIPSGVWSSSDNGIASIDASGTVSGLTTGNVTITYYAVNTCDTATVKVIVEPLPDAGIITGNTKLCTGVSGLLTDTVNGGIWSSVNTTIATVDATGTVTGIAAGSINISYSYTNSCGTAKTGIILTINQTPAMAHITTHPDTALCTNTLFQNFGTDGPAAIGTQYIWSAQNAVVFATSSSRQYCLISFNTAGISVITLSTSQSVTDCISADSIIYHINTGESPDPGVVYYPPEFVCQDNTADSYQWGYDDTHTLDSTLLPGMVNENYYNPNPDLVNNNYWVLTYHNGCLQKSYYNMPESIVNANGQNSADIIVFPNPASEEINMKVKGLYGHGITDVKLFDILGKERKVGCVVDGAGKLDLSDLPPDVYMLLFSRNGMKIGTKVFVKN